MSAPKPPTPTPPALPPPPARLPLQRPLPAPLALPSHRYGGSVFSGDQTENANAWIAAEVEGLVRQNTALAERVLVLERESLVRATREKALEEAETKTRGKAANSYAGWNLVVAIFAVLLAIAALVVAILALT